MFERGRRARPPACALASKIGIDSAGREQMKVASWTPDNPHQPANDYIIVKGIDVGNVWVRGGQTPGTENMWVRVFDGTDWSAWDLFTFTTIA
jgi:hypothetical protein